MLFLVSINSFAREGGWGMGTGAYTQAPGTLQTSVTGKTNTFSFAPYLFGQYRFHLFGEHDMVPEFGFLFPKNYASNRLKSFLFFLNGDLAYPLFSFMDIRYGPGLLFQHLRGKGGAKELNDGGSTSIFYSPNTFKTSAIFTANIGLEFHVWQMFAIRTEMYWLALLSGHPQWNGALALAYTF